MRVGFVGVGRHATNALYPSLRPAGLDLVATCATSLTRAQAHADAFGAKSAFDNVEQMLDATNLDGVVACVPPDAYAKVVLPCLARGIPVLTEKPAGASVEQIEQIEQASLKTGVAVMVGYMKRFARGYDLAHRRIDSPDFGRVTSLHAKFVMGPGFDSLRNYLIDNPVHMLDLLRFFGGEVATVEARVLTLDKTRHAVSLLLTFESGAVGTAQLGTTASFFQDNELLEIIGEGHSLTVANVDTLTVRPPTGLVEVDRPTYTVPLKSNFTGDVMGFVPELEHFREVVMQGVPCRSDVTSARRTLALAEEVWAQLS
jgi:predicted dehydrogenase